MKSINDLIHIIKNDARKFRCQKMNMKCWNLVWQLSKYNILKLEIEKMDNNKNF